MANGQYGLMHTHQSSIDRPISHLLADPYNMKKLKDGETTSTVLQLRIRTIQEYNTAYQIVQQRVYECSVVCQRNQEGPRPQEVVKLLHVGIQLSDHLSKDINLCIFATRRKYGTYAQAP